MGVIDIIVLVLLLLSLRIGFFKGFKQKHLYSFASTLGCMAGYLCGVPLAHGLRGTALGNSLLTSAYRKTRPNEGLFMQNVASASEEWTQQLHNALSELHVPAFFQGFVINHVLDLSGSVSLALASSFAYRTLILASFLIVYLLVSTLTIVLLRPLWKRLFGEEGNSLVGRFVGRSYSLARRCLSIFSLLIVFTLINQLRLKFNYTARNDFLVKDLSLDDPSSFSIGRLFYDTANSFRQWITLLED